MILLDTHALVWLDGDEKSLGRRSRRVITEAWAGGQVAASAISFWECALLHRAGRLVLPSDPARWRAELLEAGLIECPLTGDVAVLAVALDLPHRDPADRFIAATAISRSAILVTADRTLLRWKHALARQDASK